jgi:hypothetical protein
LVELVIFAKFDLKNFGEVVIGQGDYFSEHIGSCITGALNIQKVNSKEFPFGNY